MEIQPKRPLFYELVLSGECTRSCPFCKYAGLTNNGECNRENETEESIRKFFETAYGESKGPFRVVMFGGEPTLNAKGIELTVDLAERYGCETGIVTNGDLLMNVDPGHLRKIDTVTISAYDFHRKPERYRKMLSLFPENTKKTMTYTFTKEDIRLVPEFAGFCANLKAGCKVTLSHSPESWEGLSYLQVYSMVKNVYLSEMERLGRIPDYLRNEAKRLILESLGIWSKGICLGNYKKVWMGGRFVGECRIYGDRPAPSPDIEGCRNCIWDRICRKSCMHELGLGAVRSNLCAIEAAKFSSLKSFILKGGNDIILDVMQGIEVNSKVVCGILHLREASMNLKEQFPEASLSILRVAEALANECSIGDAKLEEFRKMAEEIKDNEGSSC